jgi:endonuclease YncB( thermonuclease family)
MKPAASYVYRARLVDVTDGDTIIVTRDLGDHIYQQTSIRLLGVDCPEVHGATKTAGDAATAFTRAWLDVAGAGDWPLTIETHMDKREKYGRLMAKIWRESDGRELTDDLLAAQMAVPFMTGGQTDPSRGGIQNPPFTAGGLTP